MVYIIILLLIVLNAYFSLAEIALVSVKQHQLLAEKEKKNKKAIEALKLVKEPEEFLGAVQVGITLLGMLEGIYGGSMVAVHLQHMLQEFGVTEIAAHILSLVFGIGLITYLTIIIGELLPKSIALQAPLKVSLAVAPSLFLFTRFAYPFIKLLTISTRFLLKLLHIKTQEKEQVSEQDIKRMLSMAHQQGTLEKEELWLHENVFAFGDLTAERMMKPLDAVRSLNYDWSRKQVQAEIARYPYSFFPVYKNSPGNIEGIISVKQFFLHQREDWQADIIKDKVLAADMEAPDVFNRFKEQGLHFGLVEDAQHKCIGIVTMQDVMEGVFGDIPELEDFRKYFFQLHDKSWKASGFIHLQRIRRTLGLDWIRDYEQKYINLNELFNGELQHTPKVGETITIHDLSFTAEEMKDGHIQQVRIRKIKQAAAIV